MDSSWRFLFTSAIKMVLFAYLNLLIFLLTVLIPACDSSSPAFHMMYSTHKLNNQGDNIQPWCTTLPILNQSFFPCPVLTVASWPAYWFLKSQVRLSGIPISLWVFQFIVIHTVKGSSVVSEAELDVFLEFPCVIFFYDSVDVGNSFSGFSAFPKSSLYKGEVPGSCTTEA